MSFTFLFIYFLLVLRFPICACAVRRHHTARLVRLCVARSMRGKRGAIPLFILDSRGTREPRGRAAQPARLGPRV